MMMLTKRESKALDALVRKASRHVQHGAVEADNWGHGFLVRVSRIPRSRKLRVRIYRLQAERRLELPCPCSRCKEDRP